MRRSELKNKSHLYRNPEPAARLELFDIPNQSQSIWKRKHNFSAIAVMVVFTIVFLLTLVALSHAASPPRSRGARPIALGNGYTANSGDAYALFYNPGGLYDVDEKEVAFDYGRMSSEGNISGSDFNGLYAMPFRHKDRSMPLAVGVYGESPAAGAHIVEVTAGAGSDAPVDRWTRGIIKLPVRLGGAVTIRHQEGASKSTRVGKSAIGLSLTGGAIMPINKDHQIGLALRHFAPSGTDPRGPALVFGVKRHHREFLDMYCDLEWASGGVWRFHPGLEWMFARGVLRPRLGWGYRDKDGIDTVATGIGFYLSPIQIDIAYLIPTQTTNDNVGQFRASLVYRFGKLRFSEIYYDRALEQAGQLDKDVTLMTVREAELKASLDELNQKKRISAEELEDIKKRVQALKEKDLLGERDATIRDLKVRIRDLESALSNQRSETSALRQKKAEVRTHKVARGDTLQSIARTYYGDPNLWKRIYNANSDKIDRGLPQVGATLVIP